MNILPATPADYKSIQALDHHISPEMLARKIAAGEIIVAKDGDELLGWLRYGYFWDNLPFMNMLTVIESQRGHGIGTQLVTHWENDMRSQGFDLVLTSTLANETAQHLYRKLGYTDCGALFLPGEAAEIFLKKQLI